MWDMWDMLDAVDLVKEIVIEKAIDVASDIDAFAFESKLVVEDIMWRAEDIVEGASDTVKTIRDIIAVELVGSEITEQIEDTELENVIKAKIKEKFNESISVNDIDDWDKPICDVGIKKEELKENIEENESSSILGKDFGRPMIGGLINGIVNSFSDIKVEEDEVEGLEELLVEEDKLDELEEVLNKLIFTLTEKFEFD